MALPLALLAATAIKGGIDYFGSKSAEKTAKKAALEAEIKMNKGIDAATGEINAGYDSAATHLDPYAQSGVGANRLLSNALGVNGAEAQQSFFADFEDDPGFKETLDAGQRQVEHSAIFRGSANSGGTMKDLYSFGQRAKQSQFQTRLEQLSGLAKSGYAASAGLSDLSTGRATTLADLALKKGGVGRDTALTVGGLAARGIAERTNILGSTAGDLVSAFAKTGGGPSGSSIFG